MKASLISLFILSFMGVAQAAPANRCSAQKKSASEVTVQIGDRQIEVIGWMHLDAQDVSNLKEGFNNAIQSAQQDQCLMVKNYLTGALHKQNSDIQQAAQVFRKLEATHRAKPLAFVGVELSPSELSENYTAQRSIREGLNFMQAKCGEAVAPEVSAYAMILPGPEYAFNQFSQGTVLLKALEDEDSKAAGVREMASKSSPQRQMAQVKERNRAIAKNTLSQEGHGAVVVGQMHVSHLVDEMIQQCKSPLFKGM